MSGFRSFDSHSVDFSDTTTILVGHNAAGKTNTVEALQMLTAGYSFRRPTPRQLINDSCEEARIALHLEGDGRVMDMACDIAPGKRQYSRNGRHRSRKSWVTVSAGLTRRNRLNNSCFP